MRLLSRQSLWIIGLFAIIALIVYGASLSNDFVRFDDGLLIFENPAVRQFSFGSLKTFFTSYDPELYIPLTFLTYHIEYLIAGQHAFLYHLTNLILHIFNAVLVAWLCFRLLPHLLSERARRYAALIGGLLFLVHPLHTEAVAWAAARKDVLSTAFFLGSIAQYLLYREHLAKKYYRWSVVLFVLGLMSKVMVITLPAILLLIDWQHGREWGRKMLIDKVPYVIASVIFGIIALFGKTAVLASATFGQTVLMAGRSVIFYLYHLFVPVGFSVLYPYTNPIGFATPDIAVSWILLAFVLLGALASLRWGRHIFFGIVFFLVTLVPPSINFSKAGDFYLGSDRYAYIPSIGIFFVIAWVLARMLDRGHWERRRRVATIGCAIVLVLLGSMTYSQSQVWASTEALFRNVLMLYPDSYQAHNNIGNVYRRKGMLDEAVKSFESALKGRDHERIHLNLGAVYRKQGRISDALKEYEKAKALKPDSHEAVFGEALVYADFGRSEEALQAYTKAIEMHPMYAEAYLNRGALLLSLNRRDEAIADYRTSIELQPSFVHGHYNLAVALEEQSDFEGAIAEYRETIRLQPQYIPARINLGVLYYKVQRITDARQEFEAILDIDPSNAAARSALEQLGTQ